MRFKNMFYFTQNVGHIISTCNPDKIISDMAEGLPSL